MLIPVPLDDSQSVVLNSWTTWWFLVSFSKFLNVYLSSNLQQYLEQKKRNEEAGVLTELVRDFLDPGAFYEAVRNVGIDFFTGVPDSLLKG